MIKIPSETKKYAITNNSDLFGNIWYTKNCNFDEEGYIKLSSRSVSIKDEKDDDRFDVPSAFGRSGTGIFYGVTIDRPYDINIAESTITVSEDTAGSNDLVGSDYSNGTWWQRRWYATQTADLKYTTGSGYSASVFTFVNSGVNHTPEVFRNRNTLCITDGNVVSQISTSHSTSGLTQLTLPSDYETIGLAYSNYKIGVLTRVNSATAGEDIDSYFFTWNGVATEAGVGVPIGSDVGIAVAAYKSSWVVLTRTGQLLYFTGAGFEPLATLPFYYLNATWGDYSNLTGYGRLMKVEGDVIYLNLKFDLNQMGEYKDTYLPNVPSGILCFDPKVGFYHRYSPSNSRAYILNATSSNINTTTDTFTISSGTIPATGNPIKYLRGDGSGNILGLKQANIYYIIKESSTVFRLAETKADALAGNQIDIQSTGDTNNYFMAVDVVDYGTSIANRTGAMALFGTQNTVYDHLIFGTDLVDHADETDTYAQICITTSGFENRGYFVTPRIPSQTIQDAFQRITIKHSVLTGTEKIIVKARYIDVDGLPMTTTKNYVTHACTWTSSTVFTTTQDLSKVKDYFNSGNEVEVEIISGAGANQMAQVSNIQEPSVGSYIVTLQEEIDGAASSTYCSVVFDSWKKLGEITTSDTKGYKTFPVGTSSKWCQFKVEMRGSDIRVEENLIDNSKQQ